MLPTRQEAHALLLEAERCNPGPWGNHSRIAAHCAEKIAAACQMDPEKAYVLGLLHDIGRKFGVKHLAHVWDGWQYMQKLGFSEVAKVCLTHSFNNRRIEEYVGNADLPEASYQALAAALESTPLDDYDRLIQLCDAMAGNDAIVDVEERMADVKRRYGHYPLAKWQKNLWLKTYFETKARKNLYEMVDKEHFTLS